VEVWRLDTCCWCYFTTCQWCSRVILDHCSTRYKIGVVPCILSPIIRLDQVKLRMSLYKCLFSIIFSFPNRSCIKRCMYKTKSGRPDSIGCSSCFSCKLVECSYRQKAARKQGFELSFSLSCSSFLKWVVIIFSGNFTG
jgi:hypothetical protein